MAERSIEYGFLSRDGGWIVYETQLDGAATGGFLTSERVEVAPTFRVLDRTRLFDRSSFSRNAIGAPFYDVSPDGRRFIMSRVRGESTEQLVVVLNWFEELKARRRAAPSPAARTTRPRAAAPARRTRSHP